MSGDHIRWDFSAVDDFDAELGNEKAFNSDASQRTESAYRSLSAQLDGGSGSQENATLDHSHAGLYEDVDAAGARAQQGIRSMQDVHRAGMQNALNRLQG